MKMLLDNGDQIREAGRETTQSQPVARSASTMESELLGYKRKVEQMTVLLSHYQSELESQKVRRDGVETVSRLLAECRQENMALKKSHAALEMTVKNLHNRLAVNGISPKSAMNDNEVIVPGTSKQTLTNLAMENKRLRSMLQESVSSEMCESVQKAVEDPEAVHILQETIDKLEAENKCMKMKLSDLEALFKSSNNEKDRQLVQFHNEIQQLRQQAVNKPQTVEATGLSAFKEQLKTFMSMCQNFETQLDTVQETVAEKEKASIQLTPVTDEGLECTDSRDGADVKQLLEEKQMLQDKVEEVTKINQRWQTYCSERDRYTQSLEAKIKDLDDRLEKAMHTESNTEVVHCLEQALEKSHAELAQTEALRKKAEIETEQLKQLMAAKDGQLAQLQSQVTILSRASPQPSAAEASGIIEHLKAQIQVCTEDFEKERQDRQMALKKMASLQEQNARLQKLNNHLQTLSWNQMNQTSSRSVAQESGYHDLYSLQSRNTLLQSRAQATLDYDGPQTPGSRDNSQDFADFDFDSSKRDLVLQDPGSVSLPATTMELIARGSNKPKHSLSDSALDSGTRRQENILTCPKCNKEFSEERQGELLAHMDMCWE